MLPGAQRLVVSRRLRPRVGTPDACSAVPSDPRSGNMPVIRSVAGVAALVRRQRLNQRVRAYQSWNDSCTCVVSRGRWNAGSNPACCPARRDTGGRAKLDAETQLRCLCGGKTGSATVFSFAGEAASRVDRAIIVG